MGLRYATLGFLRSWAPRASKALIWASTTPVPNVTTSLGRTYENAVAYNKQALASLSALAGASLVVDDLWSVRLGFTRRGRLGFQVASHQVAVLIGRASSATAAPTTQRATCRSPRTSTSRRWGSSFSGSSSRTLCSRRWACRRQVHRWPGAGLQAGCSGSFPASPTRLQVVCVMHHDFANAFFRLQCATTLRLVPTNLRESELPLA